MNSKGILGVDALVYSDSGERIEARTREDWDKWVSATRTRNYVLGDPVLDWLNLYGIENGFEKDTSLSTYDPRTDFTEFIFSQAALFEDNVVALLKKQTSVLDIATSPMDARSIDKAKDTFSAMEEGIPIINQGVLFNPENMTYGMPDLMIRSDILHELFPDAISREQAEIGAEGIKAKSWHYRIVDIKFTTLNLLAGGELGNSSSNPAYKCQLFIYNLALARLLGYQPGTSFLLGRGWTQGKERGSECFERLAPVSQSGSLANKVLIGDRVSEALTWIRQTRSTGDTWSVLPKPSRMELYPNNSNTMDSPWHTAKGMILEKLEDVTLMWQVGNTARINAHEEGVYTWTDERFSPEVLGVKEGKISNTIKKILEINKAADGPNILPSLIESDRSAWQSTHEIEFYVDFETVTDLSDDFSRLPQKGGQPLIFMIGCGHMENDQWEFSSFTVEYLTESEEEKIIVSWMEHMSVVAQRLSSSNDAPRIFHWSHAEDSFLVRAYNSAWERHNNPTWPQVNWYDFLQNVVKSEPVTVKGAMAFGLKAIAKSMYKLGLIETSWEDGPSDGLGAMVGAWWASEEASNTGKTLPQIDLMKEIIEYNEVDCKVMMEIIAYLRRNH